MNRPASIVLPAACAAILLVLAPGDTAAAPGVLSLSWGTCSPIVRDITATNGKSSLIVSVIGNDETHYAYQVRFLLGDAGRDVPDAWRFDTDGCQAVDTLLTIHHLPSASLAATCPAFQGEGNSAQVRDYNQMPGGTQYATSVMRGVLVNTYVPEVTADPGQRYFLAEFRFDHVQSVVGEGVPGVLCGGLETPLCITLLPGYGQSSYLRTSDLSEIGFESGPDTWVTVNGMTGCPTVPAARSTWGQIKSAYRR